MKRTTIKDIAEKLQINISTVSRALSNHPDISDPVKAKVREMAELLHYHPSDFAINFRKKSSKVIGLIIPKLSMFFIPSIIEGISAKLNNDGYKFFILSSEESLEIEAENLLTCSNSRVDGILISLTKETKSLDHFKIAEDLGIPVVIFDKSIDQKLFDQVLFDSVDSAERCAERLINDGCQKILAIFGNENLEITEKRKLAFTKKMQLHPNIKCKIIHSDSAEIAKEKTELILDYEDFDGFFAMSDEILAGLNIALVNRNIAIKEKKVIAISEGILPKYLNSSYEFEKNDGLKMGVKAAEILLDKIINSKESGVAQFYLI